MPRVACRCGGGVLTIDTAGVFRQRQNAVQGLQPAAQAVSSGDRTHGYRRGADPPCRPGCLSAGATVDPKWGEADKPVRRQRCISPEAENVCLRSRSLRHLPLRKRSPDPAAAGFFRCFRGLCGRGCSPAPVQRGVKVFSQGRYSLDLLTARSPVQSGNLQINRSRVRRYSQRGGGALQRNCRARLLQRCRPADQHRSAPATQPGTGSTHRGLFWPRTPRPVPA